MNVRGTLLLQQSLALAEMGNHSQALNAAAESVVIAKREGGRRDESEALYGFASVLAQSGRYADAVELTRKSVVIDRVFV